MFPIRHLKHVGLYKRSEVAVVAVGVRTDVKRVLLHPNLRNTAHALYLTLTPSSTHDRKTGRGAFPYRYGEMRRRIQCLSYFAYMHIIYVGITLRVWTPLRI